MNILLTNAYSRLNGGDSGIVAAQLKQIERVSPRARVVIASMESDESSFEGAHVVRSFFYYAIYHDARLLSRIINTAVVLGSSTLWAILMRFFNVNSTWVLPHYLRELIEEYRRADKIIAAGGGYFVGSHGLRSTLSILLHAHAIFIAYILKKPVLLHAQSFGPFPHVTDRIIMRLLLNRGLPTFVREEVSISLLKNIGVNSDSIYLSPDIAFTLTEPADSEVNEMREKLKRAGMRFDLPVVGITVANRFGFPGQQQYEESLARCIQELAQEPISIVLIPQVTDVLHNDDDRLVQERIMQGVEHLENVFSLCNQFSYSELMSIYNLCSVVIGTRMHSVIFSLLARVPCVAIAYEHKTNGIMESMGLSKWVLSKDQLSAEAILNAYNSLGINREGYLQKLETNLGIVTTAAKESDVLVKEFIGT